MTLKKTTRKLSSKRSLSNVNDNDVFLSYLISPILLELDTPISIVDLRQSSLFFSSIIGRNASREIGLLAYPPIFSVLLCSEGLFWFIYIRKGSAKVFVDFVSKVLAVS
jgi:hypothetical protein